jgi:hypothetical protein
MTTDPIRVLINSPTDSSSFQADKLSNALFAAGHVLSDCGVTAYPRAEIDKALLEERTTPPSSQPKSFH